MCGIVGQSADCSGRESAIGHVFPIRVASKAVGGFPDTAAGSGQPEGAVRYVASRRNGEGSNSTRSRVGRTMPIQKRWIGGVCRSECEPGSRRILAGADSGGRNCGGCSLGSKDIVGGDRVATVQLIHLFGV